MTSRLRPLARVLRIAFLRSQQTLGAHGLLGLSMLVGAGLWLGAEVARHRSSIVEIQGELSRTAQSLESGAGHHEQISSPPLPSRSDVPRMLARMERAAVAVGLGWPRADYEIKPATDEGLASLEVRCSVRGTYPQVRSLLTSLLQDNPTLTFTGLTITRPSADKADVETSFVLVVYLAEDGLPDLRIRR